MTLMTGSAEKMAATKKKPYPAFMRSTRTEVLLSPWYTHRITHLPTGIVVEAPTRDAAVVLLAARLEERNEDEEPGS